MIRARMCVSLLLVSMVFVVLALPAVAVDHSDYGTVLSRHVQNGYFDYDSFMENADSRRKLSQYLEDMSRVESGILADTEVLAYWMNLYNAATLKLIQKNYPVESIRDIGGWLSGPWSISFVETRRGKLTLDQIEHEIIRPEFQEPRIHFALVCAARSCPPLHHEPYRGGDLDHQLEQQARAFIRSDKNRFSIKNDRLVMSLSQILSPSWYAEDFGGQSGVVQYVSTFLSDRARGMIDRGDYRVQFIEYDWSLNQTPGPYEGFTGASFNN